METGKNSQNIGDLREPLLAYISPEYSKKELDQFEKMDMLEFADFFDFEVKQTNEII